MTTFLPGGEMGQPLLATYQPPKNLFSERSTPLRRARARSTREASTALTIAKDHDLCRARLKAASTAGRQATAIAILFAATPVDLIDHHSSAECRLQSIEIGDVYIQGIDNDHEGTCCAALSMRSRPTKTSWWSIPTAPTDYEDVFLLLFEASDDQSVYQQLLPHEMQVTEFVRLYRIG